MASDEDEDIPCINESPSPPSASGYHLPSAPPTRIRPRPSTNISLATRNRVISSSNSRCWLCGLNGRHVARVLPRSDHLIFTDLRASNLLTFPSIHSFQNLIYLCPGCNYSYNERVPAWTFLPTDLDAFIAAEQAYHDLRLASYPTAVTRPDPPQALLYTRYQIRPGYVFTSVFRRHPTKEWSGSSVAAMIRSARVLGGVKRLGARLCGIPEDVGMKLQHLLLMYGIADPELPRAIEEVADDDDEDEVQDDNEDADNDEDDDDGDYQDDSDDDKIEQGDESPCPPPSPPDPGLSSPPARRTRKSAAYAMRGKRQRSQHHGQLKCRHLPPPKSNPGLQAISSKRRRRREVAQDSGVGRESKWVYGPNSSAHQVSAWFRTAEW